MEAGQEIAAAALRQQLDALRQFVDERLLAAQAAVVGPAAAGDARDLQASDAAPVWLDAEPRVSAPEDAQPPLATPNLAFNKLATMLTHLISRVRELQAEAEERWCPYLLMFGEHVGPADGRSGEDGDAQQALAAALPRLRELAAFADGAEAVALNLAAQLGSLSAAQMRKPTILHGDSALSVWMALGDALAALLRLELIADQNTALAASFAQFRRMLQTMAADCDGFGVSAADVIDLEAGFAPLEAAFTAPAFCRRVLGRLGAPEYRELYADGGNATLAGITKELFGDALARLNTPQERPGDWGRLTSMAVLATAHCWLAGSNADSRLLKLVNRLHVKVPLLHLHAAAAAPTSLTLLRLLPPTAPMQRPADAQRGAESQQRDFLAAAAEALPDDLRHLGVASAAWSAQMDAHFQPQQSSEAMMTRCVALLARGLLLAGQLRRAVHTVTAVHANLAAPVSSGRLGQLSRGLSLLKAIEATYVKHSDAISEALPHLVTHSRSGLAGLLAAQRAVAVAGLRSGTAAPSLLQLPSRRRDTRADLEDAVVAAEQAKQLADGPVSSASHILLWLCLDGLRGTRQCGADELARISDALRAVETMAGLQRSIMQECDCCWLLFFRELLPAMLRQLLAAPREARRLPHLLAAFVDGGRLLAHAASPTESQLEALDEELLAVLRAQLLDPVVDSLDAALRLLQHHRSGRPPDELGENGALTEQRLDAAMAAAKNPAALARTGQSAEQPSAAPFLSSPPLVLGSRAVLVRQYVEQQLSALFHRHAAVTPEAWLAYGEMCGLAHDVYGLDVPLPHIAPQPQDEGVDVLEVMENMDIFAACYAHSLHTQTFVERPAAARGELLHTLALDHAEAAVRTHGLGITPAAVNAAYQALGRAFIKLSQIMFADALKSRLIAEERWLEGGTRGYPLARAAALAIDVRTLTAAASPGRPSQLDQMRLILTEMGNVLGFVRMVRQAGLRHCSAALCIAGGRRAAPDALRILDSLDSREESAEDVTANGHAARSPGASSASGDPDEHDDDDGPVGTFEALAKPAGLREAGQDAARTLDATLAELEAHSSDGFDFFGSMAETLGSELRAPANAHLRKLHAVAPALTLAAVEAALVAKDALRRRRRDGPDAGFVDDGFALGLAFALKVMEQDAAFDSLQWFGTVENELGEQVQQVLRTHGAASAEVQGSAGFVGWTLGGFGNHRRSAPQDQEAAMPENTKLLLKRIRSQAAEFRLLHHTVSAARMLVDTGGD